MSRFAGYLPVHPSSSMSSHAAYLDRPLPPLPPASIAGSQSYQNPLPPHHPYQAPQPPYQALQQAPYQQPYGAPYSSQPYLRTPYHPYQSYCVPPVTGPAGPPSAWSPLQAPHKPPSQHPSTCPPTSHTRQDRHARYQPSYPPRHITHNPSSHPVPPPTPRPDTTYPQPHHNAPLPPPPTALPVMPPAETYPRDFGPYMARGTAPYRHRTVPGQYVRGSLYSSAEDDVAREGTGDRRREPPPERAPDPPVRPARGAGAYVRSARALAVVSEEDDEATKAVMEKVRENKAKMASAAPSLSGSRASGRSRKPVEGLKRRDAFADRIEEEITCQVCMGIMVAPHQITPCGHAMCGGCAVMWIYTRANAYEPINCPACRQKIDTRNPLTPARNLENMIRMWIENKRTKEGDWADQEDWNTRLECWRVQRQANPGPLVPPEVFANEAPPTPTSPTTAHTSGVTGQAHTRLPIAILNDSRSLRPPIPLPNIPAILNDFDNLFGGFPWPVRQELDRMITPLSRVFERRPLGPDEGGGIEVTHVGGNEAWPRSHVATAGREAGGRGLAAAFAEHEGRPVQYDT
ncbi:hypothetical protein IAT38_007006 [Cryptococcus sp. DSM 104549]